MAKSPTKATLSAMPNSLTDEQFKSLKPMTWVQVAWADGPDTVGLVVSNELIVSKPGHYRTTNNGHYRITNKAISLLNIANNNGKEEVRFMLGIDREQIRFVLGEVNRPRFILDPNEVANAQTKDNTSESTSGNSANDIVNSNCG